MSDKIYIKRSVKEKLPEKTRLYHVFNTLTRYDSSAAVESTRLFVAVNNIGWQGISEDQEMGYEITHWIEEVPLEEYLKEIGLGTYKIPDTLPVKQSRCCGRCDGVNDICVTDTKCDIHKELGCEICFGPR